MKRIEIVVLVFAAIGVLAVFHAPPWFMAAVLIVLVIYLAVDEKPKAPR